MDSTCINLNNLLNILVKAELDLLSLRTISLTLIFVLLNNFSKSRYLLKAPLIPLK